jgi:hypothetical protein
VDIEQVLSLSQVPRVSDQLPEFRQVIELQRISGSFPRGEFKIYIIYIYKEVIEKAGASHLYLLYPPWPGKDKCRARALRTCARRKREPCGTPPAQLSPRSPRTRTFHIFIALGIVRWGLRGARSPWAER